MKTPISNAQTAVFKYLPMIIAPMILGIGLLTGDKVTIILFLPFFLLTLITNYFIVDAWVDKEAIYIKKWRKIDRYSFDRIDKVGEFKSGITDLSIITENNGKRTFLILNPNQNFISTEYSDVYQLLIKLKMNYKKDQENLK